MLKVYQTINFIFKFGINSVWLHPPICCNIVELKEFFYTSKFIHLVNEDKQSLDLNLTDTEISKLSKKELRRIVQS